MTAITLKTTLDVTGSHFFEIDTHGVLPSFPKHISAFIDV
jgi:hypothetical protein